MKPGMGKGKGSLFERLVCKKLTKWVTLKEDPLIFWRSASSGAHATQKNKAGKKSKMYGDIMAIDSQGEFLTDKFVIECKNYKTYDLEKFLVEDKGNIRDWWVQVCNDAEKANKHPLLIFKRNCFQPMIMMDNGFFEYDEKENIILYNDIIILPFELFLEHTKPEDFK